MAAALVAAIWVAPDLARPGYSPDEEFTLFAVQGISAHGLPLLPSGLLYDRGLGYSFVSWLTGLVGGQSLPAYRGVSVVSSVLALWVLFREVRRTCAPSTAALAVLAVAVSVPFWVSATTARFYAPFLTCYLVGLALLARPALSTRGMLVLAAAAAGARWTHELAFTMVAIPLVAGLAAASPRRLEWVRRTAWLVAGLVAAQLAIFAVHALAPPTNGDVMVRRFFLWQVLNLFERPPLDLPRLLPVAALAGLVAVSALAFVRIRQQPWSGAVLLAGGVASMLGQVGVGPALAFAALPLVDARHRRDVVGTGLVVFVASVGFWMVALMAGGLDTAAAWRRLAETAFAYPLDMLGYLARIHPGLTLLTITALLARSAGVGGAWPDRDRALHGLWIGWVLWFGVIESGITARYLLLPVTFMLTALVVDGAAVTRAWSGAAGHRAGALSAVAVLLVTAEAWWPGRHAPPWEIDRPTLDMRAAAAQIGETDLIAGTDELACVLAAGRIDAWLVLDEFFRERFVVMRDGRPTGTYTGAPAAGELQPLLERAEREGRRLLVVDVLKDVPGYGWSADLVPRQLAREDLRGEVLTAADDRVRLIQVGRAPERRSARR